MDPNHGSRCKDRRWPAHCNLSFAGSGLTLGLPFARSNSCRHDTLKMSSKQRTIVITGATRGIGRGLAIAAGEAGDHVVVTGRTKTGQLSLEATAKRVREAGGTCECYAVDLGNDKELASFFETMKRNLQQQNRTLDVFVNNAYAGVNFLTKGTRVPFWLKNTSNPGEEDSQSDPGEVWDLLTGVGLRTNYICAVYATRIMAEQEGGGLIVNISSWGGLMSVFDAVYAVGKSAVDRLSAEIASNAPPKVQCFTLWPGYVATETLLNVRDQTDARTAQKGQFSELPLWNAETPLFVGRVLAAIIANKGHTLNSMNGRIVIAAEVANKFGIEDENGFRPVSPRTLRFAALSAIPALRNSPFRHLIPASLCVPWWLIQALVGAVQFWT